MNKNISIQLKAALLMMVFGLNTVVGFACAVGINFKSGSHHAEEQKSKVHIHADGSKHVHENDAAIPGKTSKDESDKDHHEKTDEECCTEKISKFDQLDKVPSSKITFSEPALFLSITSRFTNINVFYTSYIDTGIKYFVRSYHPPIPNIRVAIQSFQI